MSDAIVIRNLVKTFDGFRALDGVNLTVPSGSVYGLVGTNGAGKSSCIRCLAGIYRQDSGDILVDGQPVFENPAGIHDMVKIFRDVYPSFRMDRFAELGKIFNLDPKQPLRKFSKGMQKQAAFWLALSVMPDVLLLDEPMDGLDPLMRRKTWSVLLGEVAERELTVLVSSHNLRELEDVCDHVGILDHGKMLLQRSLSDLQENMVKIQAVLPEGTDLPDGLHVLHRSATGRLQQLILRGKAEDVERQIAACNPVYMDVLPLTLEEIFIYELGGADYEVQNILLS